MWWMLLLTFLAKGFTYSFSCDDCSNRSLSLKDILPVSYDKMKPPRYKDSPVKVKVKVSILNIRSVDEEKQAIEMDIFFHQYWFDRRIKVPATYEEERIVLDNRWRDSLWIPDTYFKNSINGNVHNIVIPYTYLVLHNNSELFMAARLGLTLNCGMNLASYPHDIQECDIKIMSLLYPINTVILEWKQFQVTKNIFLAQFYVIGNEYKACNKTYDIGTFSCLEGKVTLQRRLGYYLINRFVPSVLIVVMSFVTFWIPATAYPARVTLGVTSLLTIVTQQYHNTKFSVSYVIALNVWMLSCIAFVFFSLLEYALVISFLDKQREIKENNAVAVKQETNNRRPWNGPIVVISHAKLDKICRVLFPALFVLNSFIYCCFTNIRPIL
ncbi:glycine receptor subunit alphaZ1-like isoform X1 [Centruroides sculpturatus]|uniref:glycine receptor subunit alphaZ1-like isoform X1 n=2 Tax=Centruroides sculpturatus TaxID=218467 RepID=UPI000C6E3632|nr:glycine receptor subunit alphaZ1-like isoform X1 [Centruroides sculpturatus]